MIPLLLITADPKEVKKYLKKTIDKNSLFFEIIPEKKEFSIAEIKNLRKETAIYNSSKRVYLLENFHLSSIEAQNAFLKLLEEPPKNVLFIITSENVEKIIPTIRSRAKTIYLEKKKDLDLTAKIKDALNEFILMKNFKFLDVEISIDEIIIFFKSRLNHDKKAPFIIKEALKIKSLLESNNLNEKLTIDHLLIFIWKIYHET